MIITDMDGDTIIFIDLFNADQRCYRRYSGLVPGSFSVGRFIPEQKGPDQAIEERQPPLPYLSLGIPVVAIAEKVSPAVVSIINYQRRGFFGGPIPSSGSGVIIDAENGYVVTNYHVIAGADELKVIVQGDREYKGTLVGGDQQTDLAVVQIKGEDCKRQSWGF